MSPFCNTHSISGVVLRFYDNPIPCRDMSHKRNTPRWFHVRPSVGLGETLARCRRQSGITQAELAARLGVDRTTVVRTEASDVAALKRVVAAFSVLGYELVAVPKGADVVVSPRGEQ